MDTTGASGETATVAATATPTTSTVSELPFDAIEPASPLASPTSASIDYGTGLRIREAAANAQPQVSSSQAIAKAQGLGVVSAGTQSPSATLRLVDFNPNRDARQSSSSISFTDKLAWVISYPHSPAIVRGPPMPSGVSAAISDKRDCVFVVVIDASSGNAIDAEQACGGLNELVRTVQLIRRHLARR